MSQNIRDISQSHKVYRENYEELESRNDSRRKSLAEVKIQRGIFQGDALSPLLFVITVMPLNHIFRKCTGGYKLHKYQEKINNIEPFAKNERELGSEDIRNKVVYNTNIY